MDDFGLQVGDQLANHHNSTAFILTKNVALRADRLITRKKVGVGIEASSINIGQSLVSTIV